MQKVGIVVCGYGKFSQQTIDQVLAATKADLDDVKVDLLGVIEPDFDTCGKAKRDLHSKGVSPYLLCDYPYGPEHQEIDEEKIRRVTGNYDGTIFFRDVSNTSEHVRYQEFTNRQVGKGRSCFHFVEKPICLRKEELRHYEEHGQFMPCLIESQDPAVELAANDMQTNKMKVSSITFVRCSSMGWDKLCFDLSFRPGVMGGAMLDKSVHDWGALSTLLDLPKCGRNFHVEILDSRFDCLMPGGGLSEIFQNEGGCAERIPFLSLEGKPQTGRKSSDPVDLLSHYEADVDLPAGSAIRGADGEKIRVRFFSGWGGVPEGSVFRDLFPDIHTEMRKIFRRFPSSRMSQYRWTQYSNGIYPKIREPKVSQVRTYSRITEEARICVIEGYVRGVKRSYYVNMLERYRGNQKVSPYVLQETHGDRKYLKFDKIDAFKPLLHQAIWLAAGYTELAAPAVPHGEVAVRIHEALFDARDMALRRFSTHSDCYEQRKKITKLANWVFSRKPPQGVPCYDDDKPEPSAS